METQTGTFESIVLIDDDDDINLIHQEILEDAKLAKTIHVANNGMEGLLLISQFEIEKNPPKAKHLIFLDINMPLMDGFDFLEEFEKMSDEFQSNFLIKILTTSLDANDVMDASKSDSVSGYLLKPLSQKILQNALFDLD